MRHFFGKKAVIITIFLLLLGAISLSVKKPVNNVSAHEYVYVNTGVDDYVYAGGYPVGIYLKYDGLLVVKIADFKDASGINISPSKGILKNGDIIYEINDVKVKSKEEFNKIILDTKEEDVILSVKRNGENIKIKVKPKECIDGMYKLGIWIRDDMQGIGTMTYVTKDLKFAALGHGVNDSDTNNIAYISSGKLYDAKILGIKKGTVNNTGQLLGAINYNKKYEIGNITKNTVMGIYGTLNKPIYNNQDNLYKIMDKYNIQKEEAYIISYIEGDKKLYKIKITDIDYDASVTNKSLKFTVLDEELIEYTGGIVQGMSGSPIIQNGMLIGAVTHVLINDPTSGYAVFIENMLK